MKTGLSSILKIGGDPDNERQIFVLAEYLPEYFNIVLPEQKGSVFRNTDGIILRRAQAIAKEPGR